jgi:hypothetical protein
VFRVTTALSLGAVLLSLLRCRRKVASGRAETLSRSACEVGFSVNSPQPEDNERGKLLKTPFSRHLAEEVA